MESDKELLQVVVTALVDNKDDVSIERTIDEMGVLLSLKVNPADMGQIIGRSGQTARAIRTLLRVIGAKNNARVNLKIVEPEGGAPREKRAPRQEQAPAPASEEVDTSAVDDLQL
ncbi:MAG: KH domain-containing protein [Candidatus Komeilibacteria bacterium]